MERQGQILQGARLNMDEPNIPEWECAGGCKEFCDDGFENKQCVYCGLIQGVEYELVNINEWKMKR